MNAEQRGYSTKSAEDEYWPSRLVIRGEEVAKFESSALAQTVCRLLNEEYFPPRHYFNPETVSLPETTTST